MEIGTSNLGKITASLAYVLGRGVDAAEWTDSPSQYQPGRLPAVFVKWERTRTEYRTYGARDTHGAVAGKGIMRIHSGTALVVMSATGNAVYEDMVVKDAAEACMTAIDADRRLRGEGAENLCAESRLTSVYDWSEEVSGTTYRGVACEWEAVEI